MREATEAPAARQFRIEYGGATYSVMARGNHGRTIYEDEQVRRLWLDALGEVREQTRWRAHAYVMMDKQYNLLLEIPEAKLKSAPCTGTAQKLKVDLGTEK